MIVRIINRNTKGTLPLYYAEHFNDESDILVSYKPTNGVVTYLHDISDILPFTGKLNTDSYHYVDGYYYVGEFLHNGSFVKTNGGSNKSLMESLRDFIL